jgi:hypothetical protein
MEYHGLSSTMSELFFSAFKFWAMDESVSAIFKLYAYKSRIQKPLPPAPPIFTGVKL